MKNKLVLMVLVIASVALLGCSQPQAPSGTEIPTYEGSKVYSAPSFYYQLMGIPTEGATVEVYFVENGDVGEILNWYKQKLSDYEIVEDIAVVTVNTPQGSAEWGGVLFKKGNEAVGIWAVGGTAVEEGKGAVYYIAKGPADKLLGSSAPSTEAENLPPSDQASGEEPVERYPESVMLSYYKDTSDPLEVEILIDYGTNDDASRVVSWYKNQMVKNGWKLESESSTDTDYSLSFSRGGEYLDIWVIKPNEGATYTEIDLDYSKKGLPSEDLVQGEEPLKRYPGSVVLEHTVMTYGGKTYEIKYGTNDEPDKVFQWYNNELKNSGWQIITSSSAGTFTISASKEGATVELNIKKDAYTEINIKYFELNV